MGTIMLKIEISDALYKRFYEVVTKKSGKWRSNDKKETAQKALQSAVEAALDKFLDSLDKQSNDNLNTG